MTDWLIEMLATSSLLMLIVLAVRRPVGRWFGARAAYALWALPALRMVLPPLPGAWLLHAPHVGALAPVATAAPLPMTAPPVAMPMPMDVSPMAPTVDLGLWLTLLWAAGALLWFAWQMVRYRLFVTRALTGATLLARQCGVDIFASDTVDGPIASGVFRRRIFLPRDFLDRYSSSERRQALLHEGAHHDRHDLVANILAIGIVAVHWWNPIAHVAYRAFRADQELACDATVLADAAPADLHAYGSALVKSTVGRAPAAACAFNRTDEIKRRLRMIGQARMARPRRLAGLLLAGGVVAGGLFVTASGNSTVQPVPAPVATIRPLPPVPPVPVEPATPPSSVRGMHGLRVVLPPAAPAAPMPPSRPVPPSPPVPPVASAGWFGADVAEIRREAEQARAEALREAAEARREAAEARGEAMQEAEHARAEARREAEQARREAQRATEDARANRHQAISATRISADVHREVARSLAQTRAEMAARCAAAGHPVRADEADWGTLALCGTAPAHDRDTAELERARPGLLAAFCGNAFDRALGRLQAEVAI